MLENTDLGYVHNMFQAVNTAFEFNKEKFYR